MYETELLYVWNRVVICMEQSCYMYETEWLYAWNRVVICMEQSCYIYMHRIELLYEYK